MMILPLNEGRTLEMRAYKRKYVNVYCDVHALKVAVCRKLRPPKLPNRVLTGATLLTRVGCEKVGSEKTAPTKY